MAAPTVPTNASSVWNTVTSPKTATVSANAGDILWAGGAVADSGTTLNTPTNDGTALTWTASPNSPAAGASNTYVAGWTATADTTRTIVVSLTRNAPSADFGLAVIVFRSSDGPGAGAKTEGDTTANFTVGLTTTQANSAIPMISADWAPATGSRTYLVGAGAFTELVGNAAGDVAGQYAVRVGYHADAGAVGAYTIGTSAPTGQDVSLIVTEIKGTAGGGGGTVVKQLAALGVG